MFIEGQSKTRIENKQPGDRFFQSRLLRLFGLAIGTLQCINVRRYFISHVLFLNNYISSVILTTTFLALFCLLKNVILPKIQRNPVCALMTMNFDVDVKPPFLRL